MANCVVVQFTAASQSKGRALCNALCEGKSRNALKQFLEEQGTGAGRWVDALYDFREEDDDEEDVMFAQALGKLLGMSDAELADDEDADEELLRIGGEHWRNEGTRFWLALLIEDGYEEELVGFLRPMFACLPVSDVYCKGGDSDAEGWWEGYGAELQGIAVSLPESPAPAPQSPCSHPDRASGLPAMSATLANSLAARTGNAEWRAARTRLWRTLPWRFAVEHRFAMVPKQREESVRHFFMTGEIQAPLKKRGSDFGLSDALSLFPVRSPDAVRYLIACYAVDRKGQVDLRDLHCSLPELYNHDSTEHLASSFAEEEDALFDWMFGTQLPDCAYFPDELGNPDYLLNLGYVHRCWLGQIKHWLIHPKGVQPPIARRLDRLWSTINGWPDEAFQVEGGIDEEPACWVEEGLWPLLALAEQGLHLRGLPETEVQLRRAFLEQFPRELELALGQRPTPVALNALRQVRQQFAAGDLRPTNEVVLYFRLPTDLQKPWQDKLFAYRCDGEEDDRPYPVYGGSNNWIDTQHNVKARGQLTEGLRPLIGHHAGEAIPTWLAMCARYRALRRIVTWNVAPSGLMRLSVTSSLHGPALLDELYALFALLPVVELRGHLEFGGCYDDIYLF